MKKQTNPNSLKNIIPPKKGEVRNPNGRPLKTVGWINEQLERQGFNEVSKREVVSCYMRILNLSIPELKRLSVSNDEPALVVIVAKAILENKGFDIVEKMLDRAIGKPDSRLEIDAKMLDIDRIELSEEDRILIKQFTDKL